MRTEPRLIKLCIVMDCLDQVQSSALTARVLGLHSKDMVVGSHLFRKSYFGRLSHKHRDPRDPDCHGLTASSGFTSTAEALVSTTPHLLGGRTAFLSRKYHAIRHH
ncbi:hypothetical protein CERSUDRAFT_116426 [Gelatoporia subvermispora B]|uniref:Uncharacterized protein n=1 Tax=Ceriporiopsis subvermispora (strain B) TaxID=914234 RepID=M2RB95_CERS8|nr:hypothetical protein CERSUDRAFT_116426 [Gelatoporia subvermispora B]